MILADKLALLCNMPAAMLTAGIRQTGYKQDQFKTAKFLGLSNGNQFVYSATFVDSEGETCTCKVFVDYDPTQDKVSVDY